MFAPLFVGKGQKTLFAHVRDGAQLAPPYDTAVSWCKGTNKNCKLQYPFFILLVSYN